MNRRVYLSPTLQPMAVKVEKGFATSSASGDFGFGDKADFGEESVEW